VRLHRRSSRFALLLCQERVTGGLPSAANLAVTQRHYAELLPEPNKAAYLKAVG